MRAVKKLTKTAARAASTILVFPAVLIALFGRFHGGFVFCAQALALLPGAIGSYLRVAFYSLTLERCGEGSHIAIGSYFSHSQASVGDRVGIGAYCVLGQVDLGDRTLLGSGIQILSGTGQHRRDTNGRLTDEGRVFRRIRVGTDCWIGAGSMVMADIGAGVTLGAGSVVTKPVPAGATAAGNPARIIRTSDVSSESIPSGSLASL